NDSRLQCIDCTSLGNRLAVGSFMRVSSMGASTNPEIVPLFATPLVILDVPDAPALNAELRQIIQQREKSHPSTQKSNLGGWQSSWDMDRWGGAGAVKLLAFARNLANRVTTKPDGAGGEGPYPG